MSNFGSLLAGIAAMITAVVAVLAYMHRNDLPIGRSGGDTPAAASDKPHNTGSTGNALSNHMREISTYRRP
jgi:hypothetical protein